MRESANGSNTCRIRAREKSGDGSQTPWLRCKIDGRTTQNSELTPVRDQEFGIAADLRSLKAKHVATEIDIVRDLSRKLDEAGIGYMLTGSMAMNYYAQPRMTRDIDVVVAIGLNDVERMASLFEPEYYLSRESIRESIAHESVFNLIHHESVIKVDFIVRKQSEYRQVEFERRQKISILDFTTCIVSKEDLIISKLWWAKDSHSELQLGDVKNLLETGYDTAYLERWTLALGLNNLLQTCLHD
jgi:hypothetical protein